MACGCAERMRHYVLPWLGFALVGTVWENSAFPEPSLRAVPDEDVEAHHTALTARMMLAWTTNAITEGGYD
jgi:hypothetical protein